MIRATVLIVFVCINLALYSQDQQEAPDRSRYISFGLGASWINDIPGMSFQGQYQQLLGEHILTGVVFRLSSSYKGIKNQARTISPNNGLPAIQQEVRNLSGMTVHLGYKIFPGPHHILFQGGPGLYLLTSLENQNISQQIELRHASKVIVTFETTAGYSYEFNNGVSTGIQLIGLFSGEASQLGIAVQLKKTF